MHPRRHLAFARGTSSFTNNDDYITAAMQPWVHSGWTLTSTAGVDSQLLLFCSRPWLPWHPARRRRMSLVAAGNRDGRQGGEVLGWRRVGVARGAGTL